MFTCPSEGSYSVLGLVPGAAVMDSDDHGPVLVHMTACKAHLKPVKAWLRSRMLPADDVITLRTAVLMDRWDQIVAPMQAPVFGAQQSA